MTRTQARNFYYGLRLLPPPTREALYAVYAWMRVADDIADEGGAAVEDRRARLDQLASDTRVALTGEMRSEHAVLVALAAISQRYALPVQDFDAAIEGQRRRSTAIGLHPRWVVSVSQSGACARASSLLPRANFRRNAALHSS
jgi:phytoene/squalene synthetase